jgi:hypothetical protein
VIKLCNSLAWVFTWLAIAMLVVATLAVPTHVILGQQSYPYAGSCPNPNNNPCFINNNNPAGCPGLACTNAKDTCLCVWSTPKCICPQ